MAVTTWLEVIAAVGSLLFIMTTTGLGFSIRTSARWARQEQRQEYTQRQLDQHLIESQRRTDMLYQTIRDNQNATNERLTWLEHERARQ